MRTSLLRRVLTMLLLAGSGLFVAPSALARSVVIVNGTRTAMMSLEVRGTRSQWRGNVLRDGPLGVLRPKTIFVSPDDCVVDIKATFEDGHRVRHPDADLCGTYIFVFRDY